MNLDSRFKHETLVMSCWNVVEDISTVAEFVSENDMGEVENIDRVLNMLLGLSALYQVKFDLLFNNFEKMLEESNE